MWLWQLHWRLVSPRELKRHPSGVIPVPCFTGSARAVPICQECCIIRVQGFHTPELSKLSGGACSSYPQGTACRLEHGGPACCTSPGVVLAPIGGGPWALKSVNWQLVEISPPAPGMVIRGAAGFKGLRSSSCDLAARCSGGQLRCAS